MMIRNRNRCKFWETEDEQFLQLIAINKMRNRVDDDYIALAYGIQAV